MENVEKIVGVFQVKFVDILKKFPNLVRILKKKLSAILSKFYWKKTTSRTSSCSWYKTVKKKKEVLVETCQFFPEK